MIQPPSWAKHAVPSKHGWHDPRTNELLKSVRISDEQINEYMGISEPQVLTEVPDGTGHGPSVIDESPMANDDLDTMTKLELEELGREHGIELDRRKTKADLVQELREHIIG